MRRMRKIEKLRRVVHWFLLLYLELRSCDAAPLGASSPSSSSAAAASIAESTRLRLPAPATGTEGLTEGSGPEYSKSLEDIVAAIGLEKDTHELTTYDLLMGNDRPSSPVRAVFTPSPVNTESHPPVVPINSRTPSPSNVSQEKDDFFGPYLHDGLFDVIRDVMPTPAEHLKLVDPQSVIPQRVSLKRIPASVITLTNFTSPPEVKDKEEKDTSSSVSIQPKKYTSIEAEILVLLEHRYGPEQKTQNTPETKELNEKTLEMFLLENKLADPNIIKSDDVEAIDKEKKELYPNLKIEISKAELEQTGPSSPLLSLSDLELLGTAGGQLPEKMKPGEVTWLPSFQTIVIRPFNVQHSSFREVVEEDGMKRYIIDGNNPFEVPSRKRGKRAVIPVEFPSEPSRESSLAPDSNSLRGPPSPGTLSKREASPVIAPGDDLLDRLLSAQKQQQQQLNIARQPRTTRSDAPVTTQFLTQGGGATLPNSAQQHGMSGMPPQSFPITPVSNTPLIQQQIGNIMLASGMPFSSTQERPPGRGVGTPISSPVHQTVTSEIATPMSSPLRHMISSPIGTRYSSPMYQMVPPAAILRPNPILQQQTLTSTSGTGFQQNAPTPVTSSGIGFPQNVPTPVTSSGTGFQQNIPTPITSSGMESQQSIPITSFRMGSPNTNTISQSANPSLPVTTTSISKSETESKAPPPPPPTEDKRPTETEIFLKSLKEGTSARDIATLIQEHLRSRSLMRAEMQMKRQQQQQQPQVSGVPASILQQSILTPQRSSQSLTYPYSNDGQSFGTQTAQARTAPLSSPSPLASNPMNPIATPIQTKLPSRPTNLQIPQSQAGSQNQYGGSSPSTFAHGNAAANPVPQQFNSGQHMQPQMTIPPRSPFHRPNTPGGGTPVYQQFVNPNVQLGGRPPASPNLYQGFNQPQTPQSPRGPESPLTFQEPNQPLGSPRRRRKRPPPFTIDGTGQAPSSPHSFQGINQVPQSPLAFSPQGSNQPPMSPLPQGRNRVSASPSPFQVQNQPLAAPRLFQGINQVPQSPNSFNFQGPNQPPSSPLLIQRRNQVPQSPLSRQPPSSPLLIQGRNQFSASPSPFQLQNQQTSSSRSFQGINQVPQSPLTYNFQGPNQPSSSPLIIQERNQVAASPHPFQAQNQPQPSPIQGFNRVAMSPAAQQFANNYQSTSTTPRQQTSQQYNENQRVPPSPQYQFPQGMQMQLSSGTRLVSSPYQSPAYQQNQRSFTPNTAISTSQTAQIQPTTSETTSINLPQQPQSATQMSPPVSVSVEPTINRGSDSFATYTTLQIPPEFKQSQSRPSSRQQQQVPQSHQTVRDSSYVGSPYQSNPYQISIGYNPNLNMLARAKGQQLQQMARQSAHPYANTAKFGTGIGAGASSGTGFQIPSTPQQQQGAASPLYQQPKRPKSTVGYYAQVQRPNSAIGSYSQLQRPNSAVGSSQYPQGQKPNSAGVSYLQVQRTSSAAGSYPQVPRTNSAVGPYPPVQRTSSAVGSYPQVQRTNSAVSPYLPVQRTTSAIGSYAQLQRGNSAIGSYQQLQRPNSAIGSYPQGSFQPEGQGTANYRSYPTRAQQISPGWAGSQFQSSAPYLGAQTPQTSPHLPSSAAPAPNQYYKQAERSQTPSRNAAQSHAFGNYPGQQQQQLSSRSGTPGASRPEAQFYTGTSSSESVGPKPTPANVRGPSEEPRRGQPQVPGGTGSGASRSGFTLPNLEGARQQQQYPTNISSQQGAALAGGQSPHPTHGHADRRSQYIRDPTDGRANISQNQSQTQTGWGSGGFGGNLRREGDAPAQPSVSSGQANSTQQQHKAEESEPAHTQGRSGADSSASANSPVHHHHHQRQQLPHHGGAMSFYSQSELDAHHKRMSAHTPTPKDKEFENDSSLLSWYLQGANENIRKRQESKPHLQHGSETSASNTGNVHGSTPVHSAHGPTPVQQGNFSAAQLPIPTPHGSNSTTNRTATPQHYGQPAAHSPASSDDRGLHSLPPSSPMVQTPPNATSVYGSHAPTGLQLHAHLNQLSPLQGTRATSQASPAASSTLPNANVHGSGSHSREQAGGAWDTKQEEPNPTTSLQNDPIDSKPEIPHLYWDD